jgi:hypothetical protein
MPSRSASDADEQNSMGSWELELELEQSDGLEESPQPAGFTIGFWSIPLPSLLSGGRREELPPQSGGESPRKELPRKEDGAQEQGTEWMPLEEGAEADFGEEYWRLPIPQIHNILTSA